MKTRERKGKMKFARTLAAAAAVALAVSLVPASAVSADTPEATENVFDLLEEPATQEHLVHLAELTEKAKLGDSEAFREIERLGGKNLSDAFPRGGLVEGDWKHVAQTNPMNWNVRKFPDGDNLPEANFEARQSAAGAGLVPYRSPAPSFSRNQLVTRDVGTPLQNEPHMCVNPQNPQNIVVASHNYGVQSPPVHVSFDGGESWRGPIRVPLTEQSVFGGDPVLACAPDGTIYYSYMSIGSESRTLMGQPLSATKSEIATSVSHDGGLTWEQPATVSEGRFEFDKYSVTITHPETGEDVTVELDVLATSFLDKNWIATGPNPDNPDENATYVSYTNFTNYMMIAQPLPGMLTAIPVQWTSEIEVFRSTDDGKTWEETPVMEPLPAIKDIGKVLTSTETDKIGFRVVQGSQLAVADDGSAYAAWYHSTDDGYTLGRGQQYVTKSSDGGDTWTEPVVASDYREVQRQSRSVPFRTTNNGSLAADADGNVYLVHACRTASKPTDDGDICFVHGTEDSSGNLSFTDTARINKDDSNNVQFFPAVDVGPDGTVHVMWGDTRDDPAGLKYHIYYTQSKDSGENWGFEVRGVKEDDTRVTDFPSNPNKGFPRGRFVGDYFAIEATQDDVFMVWTDSRLAEYGGYNQKIGFARRNAIPAPEVTMNPSSGSSGKEVTVQAHNFQPDMSVFVQVGADISACGGRTDDNGRTSCKVLMPVMAGEGVQDVVVYDESGNVATASFFTETGFDDLARADGSTNSVVDNTDNSQDTESGVNLPSALVTAGLTILLLVLLIAAIVLVLYKRGTKKS